MVVRFVEDDEVQLLLRPLSQDSMSDGLPLPGSEAASQARSPSTDGSQFNVTGVTEPWDLL